jgi:hypothetical protein
MKRVTELQFEMDYVLIKPLNTYCHNIEKGFDFMIVISGSGLKRVGKTMLATQIGKYASWKLGTPFDITNVAFGGKELIEVARSHPHKSVIIDDESREDISGKRQMESFNKDLMDFFNECGKYNDLIILIAPDYFDFSKSIAITMSDLLVNIKREKSNPKRDKDGEEVVELLRGSMDLYDREAKKKLYIWGKKNYDEYSIKFRSGFGEFRKHWCIDVEEYEKRKDAFIGRTRAILTGKDKKEERMKQAIRNMIVDGIKQKKIAEYFGFTEAYISKIKGNDLTVNS